MRTVAAVLSIATLIALASCTPPAGSGSSEPTPSASAPAPEPEKAKDYNLKATTLQGAISEAKPEMEDTSEGMSQGAVKLAIWANKNLKWSDLRSVPTTRYALVMKDPDQERGKSLVVMGGLVEISAESTPEGKFYHGGILGDDGNIYRFTAVGSTGELVGSSRAMFHGVVTGTQTYANSAGGTCHAVYLVGMFDIPENSGR